MRASENSRSGPALLSSTAWPIWLILLALAAVTMTLGYPVISGAFLANPESSQYNVGYAFAEFAAHSLKTGHGFPQWNPFMFGGVPFAASMHGDVFYPTFLLRLIMPTDLAISWGFIIHEFLAGTCTLGFLRALRLSRSSATLGAVAYMLSGPLASTPAAGDNGLLFVSALLPAALWMLVRAIRDHSVAAWALFALLTGGAALSGSIQLFLMFVLLSTAFALVWVWWREGPAHAEGMANDTSGWRSRAALSLLFLCAVFAGVALSSIQNWPAFGYVSASPQAALQSYELATSRSFPPEELINTYLPQFSGILTRYWGRGHSQLHSAYLGVVVLFFAPLAVGAAAQRNIARFFFGVAGVALLWSMGHFTPFFHLPFVIVPGVAHFRSPAQATVLFAFACATLASVGLERVLTQRISRKLLLRYVAGWIILALLVIGLSLSGTIMTYAQKLGRSVAIADGHELHGYANFIKTNGYAITYGAVRNLGVLLIIASAVAALHLKRVRSGVVALIICGVCAADLWITTHRYWHFSEPASALYRADPIVDFLKQQPQPGRVFVYTKTSDYRTATDPYYGPSGFGDGGGFMVHGLRTVTGSGVAPLARYDAVSAGMASTTPAFWQHENVRWLYTNAAVTDTSLEELVGRTSNAANSHAYLYAMPGKNPYAWVSLAYGVRPDSAALRELFSASYNRAAFVAVAPGSIVDGARVSDSRDIIGPDSLEPAPVSTDSATARTAAQRRHIVATATTYGPGRVIIALDTPAPAGSALTISENFYDGWRAESSGQSLPVLRSGYNLVGAPLPAGARSISFTFVDPKYIEGRTITYMALLFLLLATAGGTMYDRQYSHRKHRPGLQ